MLQISNSQLRYIEILYYFTRDKMMGYFIDFKESFYAQELKVRRQMPWPYY